MTQDTHAADTEYHHDVPASLTISPPTPVQYVRRGWPRSAWLVVTVLVAVMAAGISLSMITIGKVSTRANQATSMAATEAGQLASMGQQLAAVRARVAAPPPKAPAFRLPAVLGHYGVCVSFSRDTGSGALVNFNVTTPVMNAGQVGCQQGSLVSVVPTP